MLSTQQNLQIIPKSEAIRESGIAKPVYFHGECFKIKAKTYSCINQNI